MFGVGDKVKLNSKGSYLHDATGIVKSEPFEIPNAAEGVAPTLCVWVDFDDELENHFGLNTAATIVAVQVLVVA